jgi:hypothetical protein
LSPPSIAPRYCGGQHQATSASRHRMPPGDNLPTRERLTEMQWRDYQRASQQPASYSQGSSPYNDRGRHQYHRPPYRYATHPRDRSFYQDRY